MSAAKHLVREQLRIARQGWGYVVLFLILATVPYVYLDLEAPDEDQMYAISGLLIWAMDYLLFVGLMQRGGFLEGGKFTGVGTYFVLGIVLGMACIIGFLLFVLPGIYIYARCAAAFPRAMASIDGIRNSISWSWRESELHQFPLILAMAGPLTAYASSLGLFFGFEALGTDFDGPTYAGIVVASNTILSIGSAWLTIFGIAAYGFLSGPKNLVLATRG